MAENLEAADASVVLTYRQYASQCRRCSMWADAQEWDDKADKIEAMAKPKDNGRDGIIAHLSYIIGGWNASLPTHPGRFRGDMGDTYMDDKAVVRTFLERYKADVTRTLKEENQRLKAEVYDLNRKADNLSQQLEHFRK